MAMRAYSSLAHDDEDLFDLSKGMPDDYEPPDYPQGCQLSLKADDLEQVGGLDGKPGDSMRFSAMATVTSLYHSMDACRIELEMTQFAGEDGKFIDLSQPAHLCLGQSELGKIGLEPDCERGDMLHLIGTARLESRSDTEFGGQMATLQITDLAYEDESGEVREG